MVEVEAEADTEADTEQRRTVAKCIHHVPDNMNIKEGYYLMNLLYKIGKLSDYLTALDTFAANMRKGLIPNGDALEFKNYFDFDCEYTIRLDPNTGRITRLCLQRESETDDEDDDDDDDDEEEDHYFTFDGPIHVPPIIEHFQSLESISIYNCKSIPLEIRNLKMLETIVLFGCRKSFFENIPEGYQLPSSIKEVDFVNINHKFNSNLSSFLEICPNTLEGLGFYCTSRKQSVEILRALQDDDLRFRQSLKTILMNNCKLNEEDLVLLMFDIRERFTNLRKIVVNGNDIKSLCGIENKINQVLTSQSSSSSSSSLLGSAISIGSNLRILYLQDNPVLRTISNGSGYDPKEVEALLTLLNNFDGISNLGSIFKVNEYYNPDVENILRINHAGRKFIRNDTKIPSGTSATAITTAAATTAPVINHALWPLILERAYEKSDEIYDIYDQAIKEESKEDRDKRKCATGLFDLVRQHWPMFMENYCCDKNDNGNENRRTTNAALNCKRKSKRKRKCS